MNDNGLVKQYEPMINRVVSSIAGRDHRDYDDMMQIGRIALVTARRKFDESKSSRGFTYYAYVQVKYYVMNYYNSNSDGRLHRFSRRRNVEVLGLELDDDVFGQYTIEDDIEYRDMLAKVEESINRLSKLQRRATRLLFHMGPIEAARVAGVSRQNLESHVYGRHGNKHNSAVSRIRKMLGVA